MSAAALFMLLASSAGGLPIPQSLGASSPAAGSSGTLGGSVDIKAGDLVVIAVGNRAGGPTVSSVSDGTNTYVKATSLATADTDAEIWYKENASAVLSPTITVTLSGATGQAWYISGCRVAGIQRSASKDKTATSASFSVSTGALTQAVEIVFGLATNFASGGFAPSSGFTQLSDQQAVSNCSMSFEYQIVKTASSVTYNPSGTSSEPTAQVVTFKGA